jgi:hypothetical protein
MVHLQCRAASRYLPADMRCGSPACVQILSVTVADEEVTVSYCHNVASQHQSELHFTLAMPSPEVCCRSTSTQHNNCLC